MPQRPSAKDRATADAPVQTLRRPRGEPRRLLLDAARELFARKDYRSTTTREIAEAADVNEYLLFRNFGSKPDCSGKPSSYRSPISSTNSAERGNQWSPTKPTKRNWQDISSDSSTTWSSNIEGFC